MKQFRLNICKKSRSKLVPFASEESILQSLCLGSAMFTFEALKLSRKAKT